MAEKKCGCLKKLAEGGVRIREPGKELFNSVQLREQLRHGPPEKRKRKKGTGEVVKKRRKKKLQRGGR